MSKNNALDRFSMDAAIEGVWDLFEGVWDLFEGVCDLFEGVCDLFEGKQDECEKRPFVTIF